MKIKGMLRNVVSHLTGCSIAQQLLEFNVRVSHYLMGIGSGSDPISSGERSVLQLLMRELSGPYTIFDVGANQGQYQQLVRDTLSKEGWTVHCFEPGAKTFAQLKRNSPVDQRIKLSNVALGKADGEATLHYDKAGSGLASLTKRLHPRPEKEFCESERVHVTTVDEYCYEHHVEHIHLIKIDVEGHEFDVLQGAAGMLAEGAIDLITFEFGGCNIDTQTFFRDYHRLLTGTNMMLFRITPSGYLRPICSYGEELEQFKGTNFLARRKGSVQLT